MSLDARHDILEGKTIEEINWEVYHAIQGALPDAIDILLEHYTSGADEEEKQRTAYDMVTKLPRDKKHLIQEGLAKHHIDIDVFSTDVAKRVGWLESRKQQHRANSQIRRHQMKAEDALTDREWEETKDFFDNSCVYCGEQGDMTFEHFFPFSKGGEFSKGNIIPACGWCNSSKNDSDFDEWYPRQKFYSRKNIKKINEFIDKYN